MLGLELDGEHTIYRAVGCKNCNYIGYRGRSGIYELITVDDEMRRMIHGGAGEQELLQQARRHDPGILEDGRRRVLAGDTSMEEVLRVTTSN